MSNDLSRATRELMQHRPGKKYTEVRDELLWWLEGREETPVEAVAIMTDPANEIMCEKCGWTNGMVCPECPGCGCYNFTCSGWRHEEYMDEEERRELRACRECGGDSEDHYSCQCDEE
ncbi:hypothetical protein AB0J43_02595 [Nonomuraea fuscirosea]